MLIAIMNCMKSALILHGTSSSPSGNWFHWVEKFMSDRGYDVWLPQLPESETPNINTYNAFLLSNNQFHFNEETVLIGHSSGAVEILSLLQHLPEDVVVGEVYLVSAFKDSLGWDALKGLFIEPYDFELIKTKARSITFLHSDDDPYVPSEHARYLSEKLEARLLVFAGQGHFNLEKSEEYRRFPVLAQVIEANNLLDSGEKLTSFRGEAILFIETQVVADGVTCDVYSFAKDDTKDLGIMYVSQGSKTPKQRIIKGDRTIEGFLFGDADLTFRHADKTEVIYNYSDLSYGIDTVLSVGDTMRWSANQDSILYEICYPPYEDGRFQDGS